LITDLADMQIYALNVGEFRASGIDFANWVIVPQREFAVEHDSSTMIGARRSRAR